MFSSGGGANAAIAIRKLGIRSVLLGCIGRDSHALLESLTTANVDTSCIEECESISGMNLYLQDQVQVCLAVKRQDLFAQGASAVIHFDGANQTMNSDKFSRCLFDLINSPTSNIKTLLLSMDQIPLSVLVKVASVIKY